MNHNPADDGAGLTSLSTEEAEELDRLCDRFESAWRNGESPRFEDHLAGATGALLATLRTELIAIELEWKRRLGKGSLVDDESRETIVVRPPTSGVIETLSLSVSKIHRVVLRDTDGGPESPLIEPNSGDDSGSGTRYWIDGEIARGGMGAILKGRDPDLGRDVALKVLREDFRDEPDMVRRFVEEAQIGGQLQHPGIVPIYEMGTFADQRPFFSMKLVKGDTLAKLLANRKGLSDGLPRFLSIFQSMAQTVAYSHARGVIHRDLKPSNVMVGAFGEVQVMDWGLAKVLVRGGIVDDAGVGKFAGPETLIATARSGSEDSDLSRAGSILGTPSYMAPEQARGEIDRVDERADVFALGSILCEMLTGSPAFVGRSSGEVQRKAALGDLADATARLESSKADSELITIVGVCISRELEDRPRTASEVADRLTAYLVGVQDRLRRAELESIEERGRRRLTTVIAAALILFASAVGGGVTWNQRQKANRASKTARAVDDALADASRFRGEALSAPPGDSGRWSAALSAAKRAEALLAQGEVETSLKDRVDALMTRVQGERDAAADKARQIEIDRVLLGELESVRGNRVAHRDPKRTDLEYAEVFRKAGLDLDTTEPVKSGKWLALRTDPVEIAGYLDDWAFVRRGVGRAEADWRRLVAAARTGDPDPWRDAIRGKFGRDDPDSVAEFRRMADSPSLEDQPAPGLLLLARQLKFGSGDKARAAEVLRRGVRRYPGDFRLHFELAQAPGTLDGIEDDRFPLPEEAVRHLTAALGIRPGSVSTHLVLGSALLSYRKRDESEAECREAVRLKPDDISARRTLANVLRWSWKFNEAEAECRELVRLDPGDPINHNALGLVLMDEGKFDAAGDEFRESLRLDPERPGTYVSLADILQKSGDYTQAAAVLRKLRDLKVKFVPDHFHPQEWFDRADTAAALAARLPAILKGEDRPTLAERMILARMCSRQWLYAASAQLWAQALAEDPKIGDDRRTQRRYDAACYAARAGTGRCKDLPAPDEAARLAFRRQARGWLQQELEAWSSFLQTGTAQDRTLVVTTLQHWRADGDLLGIRDAEALARLPEAERKEWQVLWAEVDALARKAGDEKPR